MKTSANQATSIPICLKRRLDQSSPGIILHVCHATSKREGIFRSVLNMTHYVYEDNLKVCETSSSLLEAARRKLQEVSEAVGMRLGMQNVLWDVCEEACSQCKETYSRNATKGDSM